MNTELKRRTKLNKCKNKTWGQSHHWRHITLEDAMKYSIFCLITILQPKAICVSVYLEVTIKPWLPFCMRSQFCCYGNLNLSVGLSFYLPLLYMLSFLIQSRFQGSRERHSSHTSTLGSESHFHFPNGFIVIRFARTAKGLILNGNSCWHRHYIE